MKHYRIYLKILLTLVAASLLFWVSSYAQQRFNLGQDLFNQHHLPEGLKRYAPTRMQWLARELNSTNPNADIFTPHDFTVRYIDDGEQLRATMQYKYQLKTDKIIEAMAIVKTRISDIASEYGWQHWLKVQLEVRESLFEKKGDEWVMHAGRKNPTTYYQWIGRNQIKQVRNPYQTNR